MLLSPLRLTQGNIFYRNNCTRKIRIIVKRMTVSTTQTNKRGAFIVLEGCDRSGKSTQCSRLVSRLNENGIKAELARFPDRTTVTGKIINEYLTNTYHLDDRAIHLLFSANRWEAVKSLEEKLRQGTTVIVDRYAFSGVAFSAAKGLDLEWCKSPDVGLIRPDLVLFLDLDPEEAAKRGDYGTERYEKIEFQQTVRHIFQRLKDESWKIFDARIPISKLNDDLYSAVVHTLKECDNTNIRHELWK